MSKIKALSEAIAQIEIDMRSLTTAAEERGEKEMTGEELDKFESLRAEKQKKQRELSALMEVEELDKRKATPQTPATEEQRAEFEKRAFLNVLRGTASAEERAAVVMENNKIVVPTYVQSEIMLGLTGTYGILPHVDLSVSDSAATINYPMVTAPITLEKIVIGTKSTEGSASFKGVQLSAYDYRTQPIPVSETLLAAPDADLLKALIDLMVENIGQALSKLIIADGTDNKDFAAILKNCATVNGTASDSITYDDIVNLMAGVKAPFDAPGRAKFVVSSQTRKALLKIRDTNGYPIYVRDMSGTAPATIFGHEVVVDDALPTIAAGKQVMLFGDLKSYKCRLVKGVRVRTYDEQQYADYNCIGVQGFVTGDGRPVRVAGSVEPIAALKLKAS